MTGISAINFSWSNKPSHRTICARSILDHSFQTSHYIRLLVTQSTHLTWSLTLFRCDLLPVNSYVSLGVHSMSCSYHIHLVSALLTLHCYIACWLNWWCFSPVCTTELGRVAALSDEWKKRNVKPLALSVDTTQNHGAWIGDIADITGSHVKFPIIADDKYEVSLLYGMIDATHLSSTGMPFTVRSVYIIDHNKKVRLILTYPASTGRNFDEILRVIDSLQLADSHKVATPADWQKGQDTVVLPTVTTEEAKKLFPAGVTEVRPWLRTTPDPSKK